MANGPREPGVGAELIGSDTHQKYKSEFNDSDSCKISPIRYNRNENNEKLYDIEVSNICNDKNLVESISMSIFIYNLQKPCLTKNDMEHLDKRSVDGSESKFTQWELELQTSMEKLNRLSIENSLRIKERNAQSSSEGLQDAVKVSTMNETCYNSLSELSNTRTSNQFTRLIESPGIIERGRFSDRAHLLKSCSTIDSTTALRGTSTLAKSNISKSLNNSPINRGTSNLKITGSARSTNISKYVPNKISQFNIKDRKTQSSWDINIPYNANVTNKESEKDSCSDTNNILINKSHILTNLHVAQVSNVEFLPKESSLSRHHIAAAPVVNQYSKSSHSDVALLQSQSSSNLQKSAPCSANSSPIKLKNLLLSSARSLDTGSADQLDKGSISKRFASKTISIKELPLLSLFRQTSALSALRGKSSSMINLSGKQNLKTLLENSPHLSNIQTISAERLANVRHKLVSDCPETKTDGVKK